MYFVDAIGSSVTSIELEANIPIEVAAKPDVPWPGNIIDFIYSEKSNQISCCICHTKKPVSSVEEVLSHAPKDKKIKFLMVYMVTVHFFTMVIN